MAIIQPTASDKTNSPGHSFLHRVFAADDAAPVKSVVVDSAGKVGIGIDAPTSTFHNTGSLSVAYRAITGSRTLDATDYLIDCTANSFTVTLPTAVGITGRTYVINNNGTGVITIETTSSELIDGALTVILSTQYESVTIVSSGTGWLVI